VGLVEGLSGVAEFHCDGDRDHRDVRGSEFGAVVVAVLPEPGGDLPGLVQVLVRLAAVVVTGGGDGEDELAGSVQR
jgi:hypothetical protein